MADVSLEPAHSIIQRFGGPAKVKELTGVSRTRVYRWTQPKTKGGTDGAIPMPHAARLLAFARENGIPISADDFLSTGGVNGES